MKDAHDGTAIEGSGTERTISNPSSFSLHTLSPCPSFGIPTGACNQNIT